MESWNREAGRKKKNYDGKQKYRKNKTFKSTYMGLISKQASDQLGYHQGYQNTPLHNYLQNGHIGRKENTYPVHTTSYCEYDAFFYGFGADKMTYTNLKIYCQINANICIIVFLMFTVTIKFTIVVRPISSKPLYIGCF